MTRALATVLVATLFAAPTIAQEGPRLRAPRPPEAPRQPAQPRSLPPELLSGSDGNAPDTQRRLYELLQQYPPSLGQVLNLDPTLLTNQAYLEPYPALAAFLAQHPEIAHNPGFFLGGFQVSRRFDYNDPKVAVIRTVQETLAGVAFLIGFLAVIGAITWVLRSVIEHRRWLRVSKTHTDTHTKLLDRLTSNEDLLAYMQSTARVVGPAWTHPLVSAGRAGRRLRRRRSDLFQHAVRGQLDILRDRTATLRRGRHGRGDWCRFRDVVHRGVRAIAAARLVDVDTDPAGARNGNEPALVEHMMTHHVLA
jgi:hypothetical protein